MKLRILPKSDRIYKRILFYLAVSVSLTILILSTILYVNFENISSELTYSFVSNSLAQISYSATFMINTAKTMAMQIYFDPAVYPLLYKESPDISSTTRALKQLSNYRMATPFIDSIYIYNQSAQTVYSSSEVISVQKKALFFDSQMVDILDHVKQYPPFTPIPRRIPIPVKAGFDETKQSFSDVYSFLYYNASYSQNEIDNIIVLNVSEKWMKDTIGALDSLPGSTTFVMDNTGRRLIGADDAPMLTDMGGQPYVQRILASQQQSGYFLDTVNGTRMLVTYSSSDVLGWSFVRVIPYDSIVSKINGIKYLTIYFALGFLVLGILASVFFSRGLYKPIDSILKRLRTMEVQNRSHLGLLARDYLKTMLEGGAGGDEVEITARCKELMLNCPSNGKYGIVLLVIDSFENFLHKWDSNGRERIRQSMMELAAAMFQAFSPQAAVMEEDRIALLLQAEGMDEGAAEQQAIDFVAGFQAHASEKAAISTTAIVSEFHRGLDSIAGLYRQAQEASLYRVLHGHGSIIAARNVLQRKTMEYAYPWQLSKALVDALMLRKLKEVEELYAEIAQYAAGFPYQIFNLTLNQLAYSIIMAINTIEQNSGSLLYHDFSRFIHDINNKETREQIDACFQSVFHEIIDRLEEKKITKYDDLVKGISDSIRKEYQNHSLSINMIAEQVDMSPAYLGHLFRKLTGESIADFINRVRIEKAKELLETTNLTITEIVDRIGITSVSNFYINFKKIHGITPKEYKQQAPRRTN